MRNIHIIILIGFSFIIQNFIVGQRALGLDFETTSLQSQRHKENLVLSQASKTPSKQTVLSEIRHLYLELQNFKNDPQFHRFGFAPGHKYRNWQSEAKRLVDSTPRDVGIEVMREGVVPGDLLVLGQEYLTSKGKETEYSRYINAQFQKALKLK